MTHFFVLFAYFYLHSYYLFSNYKLLLLIQQIILLPFLLIDLSLSQETFCFFLLVAVVPIHSLKYPILCQNLLQCLYKCHLFLHGQRNSLYPFNKVFLFHHILVLHNHTKIHTLLFCFIIILINLSRLVIHKYLCFSHFCC